MVNYYTGNPGVAFGINAEQKYLEHLQNITQIHQIYKLVEADTEYIDLFARHKIEEVEGWGCRLVFTRPKKGIDHSPDLSIHNAGSGFKRTVDLAYIDIPCRIDKTYYDNVNASRWVDAIGDNQKVGEIESDLKDNISTEITHDINTEVENAFRLLTNYRQGTGEEYKNIRGIVEKTVMPSGNYFEIEPKDMRDMDLIINFFQVLSSRFKKRNTIFQKGWCWDTTKDRSNDNAWEQVETNTPTYKRIGMVIDDYLVSSLATAKLSQAFNVKYIDFVDRFAYVKETTFYNALKNDGTEDEDKLLLAWMGDVRVPVLKMREPKGGLEYKYEPENGRHWFFHRARAYVGLATCLNYIGLFLNKKGKTESKV